MDKEKEGKLTEAMAEAESGKVEDNLESKEKLNKNHEDSYDNSATLAGELEPTQQPLQSTTDNST